METVDERRARACAAKWRADGHKGEPTDEALRAAFESCVKPPKPEIYGLIRRAIANWPQ